MEREILDWMGKGDSLQVVVLHDEGDTSIVPNKKFAKDLANFLESKVKTSTGTDGRTNVAINYDHIYSLLGQLLTVNDAVMTSDKQNAAQKTLIKKTVYHWIENLYQSQHPEIGQSPESSHLPRGYDPLAD